MKDIRNINIWDTKHQNKNIYFNDIDEFINYLEKNNQDKYVVCKKHMPTDPIRLTLDKATIGLDVCLTYTDDTHNVTIIDFDFLGKDIIINPKFYEKYQNKLIEYTKNKVLDNIKQKKSIIYIPNDILTDELIDLLISNKDLINSTIIIFTAINKSLTAEQINKIKNAHLELYYENKKISTNKLIDYYTIQDLEKLKKLRINSNHPLDEIENFKYLNNNCEITIATQTLNDEPEYLNNLTKIIKILSKHQKTYNIKIEINNRELLKQVDILNTKNINFTIYNDLYNYNKQEYLKEEIQLDKLIEPIKKANLSPYEKYLAVYNIVKNFKPYKENKKDKNQARYLRYILNNDYIVCVGYSKLLKTLLDKVEIPCTIISLQIDISYDDGYTQENKPTELTGHERNIIKIDDNKYNIHGIYIADATWDNNTKYDLYNNSCMTFDKKKEAKRLESLTKEDLLLDFHNFNEFLEKLNYYLKKETKKNTKYYENFNKCIISAYHNIYHDIMTLLSQIDYNKFKGLYEKYDKILKDNKNNLTKVEKIYSSFLTEYAMYIIPLSNKTIDQNILLDATVNTKKELHKYNKEYLEILKTVITFDYEDFNNLGFPYKYDPNNKTPGYLETKSGKRK